MLTNLVVRKRKYYFFQIFSLKQNIQQNFLRFKNKFEKFSRAKNYSNLFFPQISTKSP
jgi:hypothetical protein